MSSRRDQQIVEGAEPTEVVEQRIVSQPVVAGPPPIDPAPLTPTLG